MAAERAVAVGFVDPVAQMVTGRSSGVALAEHAEVLSLVDGR